MIDFLAILALLFAVGFLTKWLEHRADYRSDIKRRLEDSE